MATIADPRHTAKDICRILGLDSSLVKEIHIHIMPDEIIMVDVRQYLSREHMEKLIDKKYGLTEIEE